MIYEEQYKNWIGVDEAGRGAYAGPLYMAGVLIPDGVFIEGLNDSKKLTESVRNTLALQIKSLCIYHIEYASVEQIDTDGIQYWNNKLIDIIALKLQKYNPVGVLIDGKVLKCEVLPFESHIKGDSKFPQIAAASILAKTERDMYMSNIVDTTYNFKKHKGYGTLEHRNAIQMYGLSDYHRKSYNI